MLLGKVVRRLIEFFFILSKIMLAGVYILCWRADRRGLT